MTESEKRHLRAWLVSDTLNFTRYFFRLANGGRKFVIGRHHRMICDKLNDVFRGKCRRLIINIAPRYSKTEIAVRNFIAMGLAINPRANFIHLSYSDNLVQDNSDAVKGIVTMPEYRELFGLSVKADDNTKKRWHLREGGGLYATSTLGQITGFGAGLVPEPGGESQFSGAIVIDDPIKPEDALSDVEREKVNRRFETTIRNRVNSRDTPIIVIMQRLHENDLCGYLRRIEPEEWDVLEIPCVMEGEDGQPEALWPFKHTLEELMAIKAANSYVFETQYMQNPRPLEGLMYETLRTYEGFPPKGARKCYVDTADTGADYLCAVCYVETRQGMWVTEVLYTKRAMEYTEPETAKMLFRNRVQTVAIESNNGGRGFARSVERIVRETGGVVSRQMGFGTFTQTKNKAVRIFSRSAEVQNLIYFPDDWEARWPEFANAVKGYRKEGRNLHDDAVDVLTGMCERFQGQTALTDAEILRDFL